MEWWVHGGHGCITAARLRLFQQSARGGKLVDRLGDKGMHQPGALMRRAASSDPAVGFQEGPQRDQAHDLHKLVVFVRQGPQFLHQDGKELALNVIPNLQGRVGQHKLLD